MGKYPHYCVKALFFLCSCFHLGHAFRPTYVEEEAQGVRATLPGELKFVHVIFRHGDRMPVDPYPTDPWNNRKYWPTGWGQLTNRGKQQHYELGKWLRKRYSSLLDARYDREQVFVQSTDVDRTLMSAQSNLAGLYEPVGNDVWNPLIKWQPIPVHSVPEKDDPVLAAKAPCPAFDYYLENFKASAEFQAKWARYKDLFDYLGQNSGRPIKSFMDAQYFNNTLFIETLYNRTLPEWAQKVYGGADLTYVSNFAFSINTYTRQLARLKGGPLLKDVLTRLESKHKKQLSPDRSVFIYSAHDTTIANMLNTLKLFQLHSPPYTACIMFELRVDDNNRPLVSVFYKNTTAEPLPMYIPGCGVSCPLSKMYALYEDVLPENWTDECKRSTLTMTYEEANLGAATGILICIIAALLCVSYGLMIYYRRRDYNMHTSYAQMA
ncbi:prostatic acid phosphatase isoform X1 [Drosophila virilis]|uniref:acid phosphatase n=1 Tax=Drosophila virilis TaxID=7244 RepID=Q8MY06_DROVI|nr:prostatic acid phosphatase [Drosophila virilis]EDW58375.1 acph [Drosophila virilis]BAC10547.1 acid phosphatase [Drosophila virilis]BAP91286.1 acid phosphatase [Drosophila virilis]BAP91287.1 acid phosphatase [Drosophila virilis]BAP91288.1 acid phosphatase [Drosophila virilis]